VRCDACGSAVLDGAAPAGPELYAGGSYAPTRRVARALAAPAERLSHHLRLRLLEGLPTGARVLEVGAGDGAFVAALRRRGVAAEGVDPYGGPAGTRARLEDLELPSGELDAIVLWHVLEHLDEPEAALAQLVPALRPGGRLLVAVPDLASLQARIGGDGWFHQDVPRHRVLFTGDGLRRLLRRSGLRVATTSGLVPEQNLLGMWQTLLNRCTGAPDVAFRLAKGERPERARDLGATLLLGPLLLLPALALELAATAAGRAGTLAAVAVRDPA
jgi:SAM-dependent methyltransferase